MNHYSVIETLKKSYIIETLYNKFNIFLKEFNWIFFFFRAIPMTYGGSQARGQIGATAAGLCHSHSDAGSKLCLRPTPQLTAMPDT